MNTLTLMLTKHKWPYPIGTHIYVHTPDEFERKIVSWKYIGTKLWVFYVLNDDLDCLFDIPFDECVKVDERFN